VGMGACACVRTCTLWVHMCVHTHMLVYVLILVLVQSFFEAGSFCNFSRLSLLRAGIIGMAAQPLLVHLCRGYIYTAGL
jgi:hypothetical protein